MLTWSIGSNLWGLQRSNHQWTPVLFRLFRKHHLPISFAKKSTCQIKLQRWQKMLCCPQGEGWSLRWLDSKNPALLNLARVQVPTNANETARKIQIYWDRSSKRPDMIKALEHLTHTQRLKELELLSLEEAQGDLNNVYTYLTGGLAKDRTRLCSVVADRRTWNVYKLKYSKSYSNIKHFFTVRVVTAWNRLPREVMESPFLEIFKTPLATCSGWPHFE